MKADCGAMRAAQAPMEANERFLILSLRFDTLDAPGQGGGGGKPDQHCCCLALKLLL